MRLQIFTLFTAIFLFLSPSAKACSFCRQKAPQGGAAAQGPSPSAAGPMVVRGAGAPKSAVNFNEPIILGVDRETKPASERGTFDMQVPSSEIYGGGSGSTDVSE